MNVKNKRFVQEYLKDLNGTQAAIRAGYSAKTARAIANKLLTKADIAAAIKTAMDKRSKKVELTQEDVVNELRRIAFGSMANLADWNEHGVRYKASDELSEDDKRSIVSIEQVMNEHGGTLKIKQHDKMAALKLLGQHMGMFVDKADITHTIEARPLKEKSDEELESDLE